MNQLIILSAALVLLVGLIPNQCQSATLQSAASTESQADPLAKPNPYSFSYSADSLGGRAAHNEQGDGQGRVQGFYTILGADGRGRRVEYVADELGYRATIQTNEVGTKGDSAANAEYIVSAPTDGQMAQANLFKSRRSS